MDYTHKIYHSYENCCNCPPSGFVSWFQPKVSHLGRHSDILTYSLICRESDVIKLYTHRLIVSGSHLIKNKMNHKVLVL